MLNIKLPKGKVARALVTCAEVYEQRAKLEHTAYHKDLEVWRKDMTFIREHGGRAIYPPTAPAPPNLVCEHRAVKFFDMAAGCLASTGDVYVDAELWADIKGYYDV